jgi:hypothetical protein
MNVLNCRVNIVEELFNRAADGMSADELGWLAGASENADFVMRNLATVIEGIGCLVGCDGGGEKGRAAGNFPGSDDLPPLLWFLAESVRHASALAWVSGEASATLRLRQIMTKTAG